MHVAGGECCFLPGVVHGWGDYDVEEVEVESVDVPVRSFWSRRSRRLMMTLSGDGKTSSFRMVSGKDVAEKRTKSKMAMRWSLEQSIENVIPLWPKLLNRKDLRARSRSCLRLFHHQNALTM